jgi:hypothetical protein
MWFTIQIVSHIILAVVFASAALTKSRAFPSFVDYLRIPFRRFARAAAIFIVCIEWILAPGLLIPIASPLALIGAAVFFLVASLFLALRLTLADETSCNCWGINQRTDSRKDTIFPQLYTTSYEMVINIFKPAWYGLRNGFLLFMSYFLIFLNVSKNGKIPTSWEEDLGIFLLCPLLICIGLVLSIIKKWFLLRQEEHPLKKLLAPHLEPLVALSWYTETQPQGGWTLTHGKKRSFTG